MATFHTVWSLDVGRSSLKAVKLRREKNNIEILAIDKIDYKPGENGVDSTEKAREAINAFRVRNSVKEPVIVAHNGQGTLSRFIKVPAFENKKVEEMVGYEASQQIPFPLDEVVWDYHVIERDYLPGEEREIGLFAARRETIDDFLVDFTEENLAVEGLTIGYLGLINYVLYDIAPQEPAIVLDIGGSHTDLILVDGKKFWIRALPHSGNEISKSIMSRLKLGFAEAEKLKVDAAKNPKHAARLFTAIIQPKLKELVNQIQQSVGFYRSQVGEAQFKNVYLLGNASRVVGMKKYLEEHMGLPVHRVQTINHLRINRDVDVQVLQANLPAFGTAFGCALQGVGVSDCTVDLIPQEEKLEKEYQRKKIHVFVALAILFVVTGLSGFIVRTKIEQANRVTAATAGFVRPYRRFDKSIREIEELNIDAQVKTLQETAELRNRPFRGLRMLGEILADLPLAETVLEKVTLGTNGGNKEKVRSTVTQKMTDLLNQKLWITSLRADKVFWPEKVEKKSGDKRRSRGKKSGDDRVLAFKFTVFAMVVQQENASASREFIRERLQAPLEQKLKASELTLDSKVRLSPGFQESRPVLLPKEHAKQGAGPAFQKGGPFFGVELTWYMRDREPPKAETEEEKKK